MPGPTQPQLNAAIETWRDTSLGIGYIAANTHAYNQVFNKIATLEANAFAVINDPSEAVATDALTSTANYADGETVSIGLLAGGTKVYTFQATLTNVDGHVKLGASETASIANLHHAINGAGGTAGTDYALATVAHPDVTAADNATHMVTVTAVELGSAYNAIAVSKTAANATWASATLTGGVGDDVPAVIAQIDAWRDTLRAYPINADSNAEAQLDAAIPALKTAVAALFT